jgi:CRISPR-associated protein Csx14
MHELQVSLDPCNPGQFYACCGLIELFDLAGARTLSNFEVNWRRPKEAKLVLSSDSPLLLSSIAQGIREAKYEPLSRPDNEGKTPERDSIAPVRVSLFGTDLTLDWWLDCFHSKACSLKCWAGQVTTQKLVSSLPGMVPGDDLSFDEGVLTTTRFGIDPRSAWVALNLGYSPNEQGQESRTYPVVEMLGAFGLQGFRPAGSRAEGFTYHLWLSPLPRAVARSVSAKPWSGLASAAYRFTLGERGSYKYFSFAEPYTSS